MSPDSKSRGFASPALTAAALVAMMAAAPAVSAADYVQAPGSTLVFASKYDGEVFTGRFAGFTTTLSFDPAQLANAKLDVVIPLTGAKTGNDDRDSTLASSDFFNVAKFAQARYTASKFRALGGNQYAADGTLSLRGVSKPVTLTFTWAPGAQPVLSGKATVKRLEFGVGGGDWADTGTIPDEVAISTKVVLKPAG
ncbi:YceI family protein [Pseudoxanthomonas wuyuanensis]